jgi:hypothetical protein
MSRFYYVAFILALVFGIGSQSWGFRPVGQVVNYGDFRYVNYIATSMTKVYFATSNGIIIYNKTRQQWEAPMTGIEGISDAEVKRIWVDRFDQQLYAETVSGNFNYDFTFERWLPVDRVPAIDTPDKHIAPPTAMFPPPGYNYNGSGQLIDPSARTYSFSDVVDDGSGDLWLGIWGYGTAHANSTGLNIQLLPYGLIQNPAYALHVDLDSTLMVAGPMLSSRRTGITFLDRKNNRFSYLETGISGDFPPVDINCLESDSTYFYAGTPQGIYIINRTNHQVSDRIDRRNGLSDDNIVSLLRSGDSLFVGTTSGLTLLTHQHDSISYIGRQQFFNQTIYDLEIVDDYLWIASSVGAYRASLETGKLQQYKDPDAVLVDRALGVRRSASFLWLASDIGLVRINLATGRTEPFLVTSRKLDGRALAVNDTVAAVASDRGLTLIYHNRSNPVIRDFGVEDGLASNFVYSLILDGDYLWVGTDRGLTRFWWNNPRRID